MAQTRSAPRNRAATRIAPVDSVSNQKPGDSRGGNSFRKTRIEKSQCYALGNMRRSKRNPAKQYQSLPTIQTHMPPSNPEQIRQCTHDIQVARGGVWGIVAKLWKAIRIEIPIGYQDEEGFHVGVKSADMEVKRRRFAKIMKKPSDYTFRRRAGNLGVRTESDRFRSIPKTRTRLAECGRFALRRHCVLLHPVNNLPLGRQPECALRSQRNGSCCAYLMRRRET